MPQCFYDSDKHNGTEQGDQKTVKIEAGYCAFAKNAHKPATDDCTDNTDDNINYYALLLIGFHNKRSNPADQSAEYDPKNVSHIL